MHGHSLIPRGHRTLDEVLRRQAPQPDRHPGRQPVERPGQPVVAQVAFSLRGEDRPRIADELGSTLSHKTRPAAHLIQHGKKNQRDTRRRQKHLHEIQQRISPHATQHRVERHHRRHHNHADTEGHAKQRVHDAAPGHDLGGSPAKVSENLGHSPRDHHRAAIARLKKIHRRHVTRTAHQAHEEESRKQQAQHRSEGVKHHPLQAQLVGGGAGSHDRFRREPRCHDRRPGQVDRQPPPGNDVIFIAAHPARRPKTDANSHQQKHRDATDNQAQVFVIGQGH